MSRFSILACVFVPFAVGCGGHQPQIKASIDLGLKKEPKQVEEPVVEEEEVVAASPNLSVTDDLVEECMLQLRDIGKAPKFDYDHFELLPEDRTVLDAIATCVTTGPLSGRALQLVGRADPRGTLEYNLALGTKRAGTVAVYLKKLGVAADQITTTTRGDLDAEGRGETAWRTDRRVDLVLMEDAKVSSR